MKLGFLMSLVLLISGYQCQYRLSQPIMYQLQQKVSAKLNMSIDQFQIVSFDKSYSLNDIQNYKVQIRKNDVQQQMPFVTNVGLEMQRQTRPVSFYMIDVPVGHSIVHRNNDVLVQPQRPKQTMETNYVDIQKEVQNDGLFPSTNNIKPAKLQDRQQQQLQTFTGMYLGSKPISESFDDYSIVKKYPDYRRLFYYPRVNTFYQKMNDYYGGSFKIVGRKKVAEYELQPLIDEIEQKYENRFRNVVINNRYVVDKRQSEQTVDLLVLEFVDRFNQQVFYEVAIYGDGTMIQNDRIFENRNGIQRFFYRGSSGYHQKDNNCVYRQVTSANVAKRIKTMENRNSALEKSVYRKQMKNNQNYETY